MDPLKKTEKTELFSDAHSCAIFLEPLSTASKKAKELRAVRDFTPSALQPYSRWQPVSSITPRSEESSPERSDRVKEGLMLPSPHAPSSLAKVAVVEGAKRAKDEIHELVAPRCNSITTRANDNEHGQPVRASDALFGSHATVVTAGTAEREQGREHTPPQDQQATQGSRATIGSIEPDASSAVGGKEACYFADLPPPPTEAPPLPPEPDAAAAVPTESVMAETADDALQTTSLEPALINDRSAVAPCSGSAGVDTKTETGIFWRNTFLLSLLLAWEFTVLTWYQVLHRQQISIPRE